MSSVSLEKRMATHSSILAWRIPWTEEPGGYSPWGHKESDMTIDWHYYCQGFICQSQSTNSPHPPAFSPWYPYIFLHLCLYFCFVNKIIYTKFLQDCCCDSESHSDTWLFVCDFTPFSMPIGPFLCSVLRFHRYRSVFMYCSKYCIGSSKLET